MKSEKVTPHPSSSTGDAKRSKLGEILVDNGAITVTQLEHALSEQAALKLPIGQVLLKLDYVTDETMRQALGHQLNVPYLDLENVMIDRSLAGVINPTFAKRHALLPVATVGRTLTIAMDDPTATAVVQDLERLTGFTVTVVTSSSRAIQRAFRRLYADAPIVDDAPRESDRFGSRSQIIGGSVEPGGGEEIDAALNQLLAHVLDRGAGDLHLEMSSGKIDARVRVDGTLTRPALGPLQERLNQHAPGIAARLRTMIGFDGAARPQAGRSQVVVDRGGRPATIDLRISVVPGHRGDSVVIRLFDRSAAPRALDAIGLPAPIVSRVGELLARSSGLLLVTGPVPASTAEILHACLLSLSRDAHVVTVEDPIAYVNDAVTQSEVGADSTFADHLRVLQQHDADVIMIGDISDRQTAPLAFRSACAGRPVLAGFSGGSAAVDVVPWLVELDVPASAISQALAGVLHQRFVRTGGASGGRRLQAELWIPDEQDARLILEQAPFAGLRESARRTTIA